MAYLERRFTARSIKEYMIKSYTLVLQSVEITFISFD